jgi:hypothetical protein
MELGFQERSFSYLQALFGTSNKIRDYEKALRSAGGITNKVANKNMMSFSASLAKTKNIITDAAITVGELLAPGILRLGRIVAGAVSRFKNLSEGAQKFIVYAGVVAAAIGPILVGLGILSGSLAAIASGAVTAFGIFSTVVGAVLSPIGAVVVLIGAVVSGVIALAAAIAGPGSLAAAWDMATESMWSFAVKTGGFILNFKENFQKLIKWLPDNWKAVLLDMASMYFTIWKNIGLNIVKMMKANLSALIEWAKSGFTKDLFELVGKKTMESGASSDLLKGFEGKANYDDLNLNYDTTKGKKLMDSVLNGSDKAMDFVLNGSNKAMEAIRKLGLQGGKDNFGLGEMPAIPNAPNMDMMTDKKRSPGTFKTVALNRMQVRGLPSAPKKAKQKVKAPEMESKLDTLIKVTRENRPVVTV